MPDLKLTALPLAALLSVAPALRAGEPGSFDLANLDRSADACVDFYQFACGGWTARNPIPSDQSRWGRFDELALRNREVLKGILEKASLNDPKRDAIDQKIGDAYAACMDEAAIEAQGAKPLQAELDRIAALKSKAELPAEIAHLHQIGIPSLFEFGSEQDFKDATQVIAAMGQGGMGLPDRDYYLKDDPKSAEIRGQYLAHLQKMFGLLGDKPEAAAAQAKTVLEIETALAKAALELVKRRDPANVYHKMTRQEFLALSSEFAWPKYLDGIGAPSFDVVNVSEPEFVKGLDAELKTRDLAAWKSYLRWHAVHASVPLLPAAFVNEDFAFFGKALTGQKQIRARWKRCVSRVDNDLGDALGQRYVEQTFGADGKQRMSKLVAALEAALSQDIETLPWMTEATKKQALVKLQAISNKIGYPEKWRDYSTVTISRSDALGNSQRASVYEFRRDLGKIGKPVDRTRFPFTTPTVNAGYNPLLNDISFPAGILQPPFFDRHIDDAVNFGGIGAVIGHELTHGFDDQGRKFDANGNLRDWWTDEDGKEFEKRASCIADQYSGYVAVADVKLNGRLTLGENTADNGGLRIALMAAQSGAGAATPPIDGFTPDQRFFLGWSQVWCQNRTDEVARMLAQVDPHSPGKQRVNGVLANMPEFQKAFACKASQPMVREDACRVW